MARLLFEEQGIRTRRGRLAHGVDYVVYTDAAGTVLADISVTSGGASIASSTVTTADIDGLGPASFRFYGPPSGQDTLFLRCPADISLGVQEIEADTDERLDALETGGGVAAHPNLAVHDALGLATDAELSAHNLDTSSVHGITDTTVLATDAEVTSAVSTHAAGTDPHGDRAYADAIAQGLDVKASVLVAATANLTLSGEQTIDGVLTSTSRVLVKNQTLPAANGIYVSAAGAWSRAADADTAGEVGPGVFAYVEAGTVNGGTGWAQTTPNPITLGTTPLVFSQFSGAGTIIGGAGLLKTGNTLDVGAGTGLTVAGDTVGISPGGVTNTQVNAAAGIVESKLALNFPTHAENHAARHAAAGADPLTGYVSDSAHTLAAHDTLGLVTDAILAAHEADTTVIHGITDTSALATTSGVTAAVSTHAGLADPHTGYLLESLLDAKGDLLAASAADTPAKLTVGANGAKLSADSSAATGLKWLGPAVLNVKAAPYNAVGDGVADDTTALQTAITEAVTNAKVVFLPPGNYKITAKLDFGRRPHWAIRGASRGSVFITQATDNTPIFDLGTDTASQMHTWEISGISFNYTNSQPAANTAANPIRNSATSGGPYQGKITDCTFHAGTYGIRSAPGSTDIWGTTFDDLWFEQGLTVGAIYNAANSDSTPNNHYGRLYVAANNMVGPLFVLDGIANRIDTIEVTSGNQSPMLLELKAESQFSIGAFKLEVGSYTATAHLFEFDPSCQVQIDHVNISAVTINVPANKVWLFWTDTNAKLDVRAISTDITLTAGTAFLLGGNGLAEVGHIKTVGTWGLQDSGSSTTGNSVTVRQWRNNRLSDDKGNADLTVALGDPNILAFQTTFTAARTINLPNPTGGNDLFNGLYYELVFSGAINGANTAIVKAGATTLATLTADVVARWTWRRHPSAPSGWIRTR